MKKNIFYLFNIITFVFAGCTQTSTKERLLKKNEFIIEGEATNFKEGEVLYLDNPDTEKRMDSTIVIGGKFQFKGSIDEPHRLFLSSKYKSKEDPGVYTSFWVGKGVIKFKGDYNDFRFAKASGLDIHDIDDQISKLKETNDRKIDSLRKLYSNDNTQNKKISSQVEKLYASNDSISINFIKNNPNNYVSLNKIRFLRDKLSKKELNTIYETLDQELKDTDKGKALKDYMGIDKILKKEDQIVNLIGNTLTGESKNLADIVHQNKYTILDFWASQCGPCRMQSKQYVALYDSYRNKGLEIVSFSLDKNREKWEEASEKDNITWINISDLNGDDGIAPMTYGIRGIPYSFLINQEGKIIAESKYYNSKKKPFENELKEFFGEGTE